MDATTFEDAQDKEFGQYRAVRRIGRGGMSIVYEGERIGDDFERRVAIKLVLEQSRQALPERETRILSQLEHPNIARLFDAGTTKSGLHYLVMEYVEGGVPCTVYCESRKLSEAARLKLFLDICASVRYANQSLVIHCDLKPGNILVSSDGFVKLLDFGIAKLLSGASSGERTTVSRSYTLDYASPEQILGEPLTVATDVYSLGVLLCEMVSGSRPRRIEGLPLDELAAKMREEIAELPLGGDLGRIAHKALRREPAERYGSVWELARDIERYLQGRPVEARSATWTYRARKFISRNRYAVGSTVLVTLALAVAAGVAIQQARLASQRFEQVRALAKSVMFDMQDEIAKLPGSLGAQQLLVTTSLGYLDTLAKDAEGTDQLQIEVAEGYVRLADIEGISNAPSMGQSGSSVSRLEQAEASMRKVLARSPGNFEARRAMYRVLDAQAALYEFRADPRSVSKAEELLKLAEENLAMRPSDGVVKREQAHALSTVAHAYTRSKTHAERGIASWRKALEVWKALYQEDPGPIENKRELARTYQFLAGAMALSSDKAGALEAVTAALRLHKELAQVPGEDVDHMIATDLGVMGNLHAQAKRYSEAIPVYEEQRRMLEQVLAKDPENTNAAMRAAGTMDRIGYAYVLLKKPAIGIPYLEGALERQRSTYAKDRGNVLVNREMLYVTSDLAEAHEAMKRRDRMCHYAGEAAKLLPGPLALTRETATDASKKAYVRKILGQCGIRE